MNENEENLPPLSDQAVAWGLCFEVAFGVLALGIGKQIGVWPTEKLTWPLAPLEFLVGMVSALPILAIMLAIRRVRWAPIRELTEFVDQKLLPMFSSLGVVELLLLSAAAGWGEELLFRGLIQSAMTEWGSPVLAILLTSILFGLFHFVSPAYFVAATGVSVYFGWLFWHFESLWVPILAHTVYDFLMFLYVRRRIASAADSKGVTEGLS